MRKELISAIKRHFPASALMNEKKDVLCCITLGVTVTEDREYGEVRFHRGGCIAILEFENGEFSKGDHIFTVISHIPTYGQYEIEGVDWGLQRKIDYLVLEEVVKKLTS